MKANKVFRDIVVLAVFVLGQVIGTDAFAQKFPERPVRVVVPYTPGGSVDLFARLVSNGLSEKWRQSVVVDNKPGGGGDIATKFVANAAPDGYTLLSTVDVFTIRGALGRAYDVKRDFAPVAHLASSMVVLIVNPKLPVTTVPELLAYAKSRPEKLSYASVGIGSLMHLAMELFNNAAGIEMVHVPYRGGAPAITDLIAGRIDLMFSSVATAAPFLNSKELRVIASGSAERSRLMPDLPTLAEGGVQGASTASWFGLIAPAGTPKSIVDRINADAFEAVNDPKVRDKLANVGIEIAPASTPEQFATHISDDLKLWSELAGKRNITLGGE